MFQWVGAWSYAGKRINKKAQTTLELAVLIIIIAAALMTTAVLVKRSIQGRIRTAADDIGEQYSPALVNAETTVQTDSEVISDVSTDKEGTIDATSTTTTKTTETTTRTGHQELGEYKDEPFFFE